jgi:hypothetical protein
MRKGDFDGYDHFADHHFAYIDFVWWRLLRSRSLVVADSIAPNSQAHRGLKEARLAGQPSPGFRVFGGRWRENCLAPRRRTNVCGWVLVH